jgi:hypothetical protein
MNRAIALSLLIASGAFPIFLHAETSSPGRWKVSPRSGSTPEVRVWDSFPEANLDFDWRGAINQQHQAEGFGTLKWTGVSPNGSWVSVSSYTGEMIAGKRSGKGRWFHQSGASYEGEWKENLKEGKGHYHFANGDEYVGEFKADKMNGQGKWVSADGTIYEGQFVNGERDGEGTVTTPNGQTRKSLWKAGAEAGDTTNSVPASATVALSLNPKGVASNLVHMSGDALTYGAELRDHVLYIESTWPYLAAFNQGGPVGEPYVNMGDYLGQGGNPVYLQVCVTNGTKAPLAVVKGELVVQKSKPDLRPLLAIDDPGDPQGRSAVEVINYGWGAAEDCQASFSVLPPRARPNFEQYRFKTSIGKFVLDSDQAPGSFATGDLAPALRELGFDLTFLRGTATRRNYDVKRVEKALAGFAKYVDGDDKDDGRIARAFCRIAGELSYGWRDDENKVHREAVKFCFTHQLCDFFPEKGDAEEPSGTYDILLATKAENYVRRMDYRRTIKPGANDRITVGVWAPQSSFHEFKVRLQMSDGSTITSLPCQMHLVVPRGCLVSAKGATGATR